ncbi:MAG: non-homologous end-joining DNA ligase [Phycisphaeraceae bacterium]
MLATPATRLPTGAGWAHECKWDGMRVLALVRGGDVRLMTRSGRDVSEQFPELSTLGVVAGVAGVVLDGEIVALQAGRPSFAQLQPRMHATAGAAVRRLAHRLPVAYLVFDLLHVGGRSLLNEPYARRRAELEGLHLAGEHVGVPPTSEAGGAGGGAMRDVAQRMGLEGIVAKRLDSPYRPGVRSADWMKVRFIKAQEFVVGGWRPGQRGTARQLGSLAVGHYEKSGEDGPLVFAGLVGSGLTREHERSLLRELTAREQVGSPFVGPAVPRDVRFVRPEVVVHVVFAEWTPQGLLRQPVFKGVREDKLAREVVREV